MRWHLSMRNWLSESSWHRILLSIQNIWELCKSKFPYYYTSRKSNVGTYHAKGILATVNGEWLSLDEEAFISLKKKSISPWAHCTHRIATNDTPCHSFLPSPDAQVNCCRKKNIKLELRYFTEVTGDMFLDHPHNKGFGNDKVQFDL